MLSQTVIKTMMNIVVTSRWNISQINTRNMVENRSQWPPCGLRRGSAAACLLELRVRIPPEGWMFVCSEYWVLSGRGVCDGLITRPEEFYWGWCVWVWSWSSDTVEVMAQLGCCVMDKKKLELVKYSYNRIHLHLNLTSRQSTQIV